MDFATAKLPDYNLDPPDDEALRRVEARELAIYERAQVITWDEIADHYLTDGHPLRSALLLLDEIGRYNPRLGAAEVRLNIADVVASEELERTEK